MKFQVFWRSWHWWPYYSKRWVDYYGIWSKVFAIGPFQWRWYDK